jgi:hypothetical protein
MILFMPILCLCLVRRQGREQPEVRKAGQSDDVDFPISMPAKSNLKSVVRINSDIHIYTHYLDL